MANDNHTVTCRTKGCLNFNIPIEVEPWMAVACGGGCGNIIQQEDPNHPDFPIYEEEETVEEMVERLVQERLNQILPQKIEQVINELNMSPIVKEPTIPTIPKSDKIE